MALVMGAAGRRTRLHAEGDLRVLWLTSGRSELALSVEGLWLRRGRRQSELCWDEIQQVQAVPAAGLGRIRDVRIEIFGRDGSVHALGPFGQSQAERWIEACAQAAAEHGQQPLPLNGAVGFAFAT